LQDQALCMGLVYIIMGEFQAAYIMGIIHWILQRNVGVIFTLKISGNYKYLINLF